MFASGVGYGCEHAGSCSAVTDVSMRSKAAQGQDDAPRHRGEVCSDLNRGHRSFVPQGLKDDDILLVQFRLHCRS